MYYRVALQQGNQPPMWKWKSTPLTSFEGVLMFLRAYSVFPKTYLRVFFSSSPDMMEAMLERENQGLISASVTMEQFMQGKCPNALDVARLHHELARAGDHDTPYTCTLPTSTPQLLAWINLRSRVERGELEP